MENQAEKLNDEKLDADEPARKRYKLNQYNSKNEDYKPVHRTTKWRWNKKLGTKMYMII